MNPEDRSRIQQNYNPIKEKISDDLHPHIDQQFEAGIFKAKDREQIIQAKQSKQCYEFLKLLTSSTNPRAFEIFLEGLSKQGLTRLSNQVKSTVPNKGEYIFFLRRPSMHCV